MPLRQMHQGLMKEKREERNGEGDCSRRPTRARRARTRTATKSTYQKKSAPASPGLGQECLFPAPTCHIVDDVDSRPIELITAPMPIVTPKKRMIFWKPAREII